MTPNIDGLVNMKPVDALASRVWSGTHWHYPHIEKMAAALTAQAERIRVLEAAIGPLITWAENAEVTIEGEWGACRSLEELDSAGELAEEIYAARAALTPTPPKEPRRETHRNPPSPSHL